jgi:hypothetical protein
VSALVFSMKLSVSILLNLMLAACLAAVLVNSRHHAPHTTEHVPSSESQAAPTRQEAFHWNQLVSTNNYRAYVANLRAVGCPESTIRAIVAADFEAACAFERRRLDLAGVKSDRFSSEAAKQLVTGLLDAKSIFASNEETAVSISTAPETIPSQQTGIRTGEPAKVKASYPLALQAPALNDSSLTESQKAAVRQIQQQFTDALSGTSQNPEDPAYARSWQTAQQDADDALRAQLGNQTYNAYKLQHYYSNFQQVMLNAGDGPMTINPDALAR